MNIEITIEEILEDLCWPGPPPGNWRWELREQPEPDQIPARRTTEAAGPNWSRSRRDWTPQYGAV